MLATTYLEMSLALGAVENRELKSGKEWSSIFTRDEMTGCEIVAVLV